MYRGPFFWNRTVPEIWRNEIASTFVDVRRLYHCGVLWRSSIGPESPTIVARCSVFRDRYCWQRRTWNEVYLFTTIDHATRFFFFFKFWFIVKEKKEDGSLDHSCNVSSHSRRVSLCCVLTHSNEPPQLTRYSYWHLCPNRASVSPHACLSITSRW
jgi:hypothetical protein